MIENVKVKIVTQNEKSKRHLKPSRLINPTQRSMSIQLKE